MMPRLRKHGQFGLEGFIDHALRRRAAIENIHAEEVGNAHAECGQRKAGHVLVGAKTDGEKAVNQAAEHRRDERAERVKLLHRAPCSGLLRCFHTNRRWQNRQSRPDT